MPMQKVNDFYQVFRKNPTNKINLVFLYRYASLALTSLFYLFGPQSPLIFKLGVVLSLFIAAGIITDLTKKYFNNSNILKAIVLTEMIGLTLLLIPTGGISSPFIWYALNPVLVAAGFLTPLFCWVALSFYLGSATIIAYYQFHLDSLFLMMEQNYYFYLVCLLTTLLARLFSRLTKELDEQQEKVLKVNKSLTETNEKYEQTLEHVMSLYHLMDSFASKKNPKELAHEITTSLIKCTQSDEAFLWLNDLNHKSSHIANKTSDDKLDIHIKEIWPTIRGKKEAFKDQVGDQWYLLKIIRTSHNVGILGVKLPSLQVSNRFFLNKPFEFLADLSEIMFERIYMDQVMEQILIIEEQNRIASEIHDSVSQRLFGIVYALHSLQLKGPTMTKEELDQQYKFLSDSANTTMKELRSAIYRLSSVKKGEQPFFVSVKKYLDEFSKINDIKVAYHVAGDERLLTDHRKQSLYRIICEACGNAVRHGHCNTIDLQLMIVDGKTVLSIKDDGIGIDSETSMGKSEQGIGLINMKNLVSSYNGVFSIKGKIGTEIEIEIPNVNVETKEGVAG